MILKVEGQWMDTEGLTYDYFENVTNPRVLVTSFYEAETLVNATEGSAYWYLRKEGKDGDGRKEIPTSGECPKCETGFDGNTATVVVSWGDDGMHYVVCNTKAYLMNDQGKTVERLI